MTTHIVRSRNLKYLFLASIMGMGLLTTRDAVSASLCTNDDECPDPACGGQVCDWNAGRVCKPAGGAAKGSDGWCSDDSDCKCKGQGATCAGFYCTFTKPSDAPGGGATGGASGTGTGGASTGTGGASSGTGGASSGHDGGTQPAKDDGGCAIAGAGSSSWLGAMIAMAGLVVMGRRRRRL